VASSGLERRSPADRPDATCWDSRYTLYVIVSGFLVAIAVGVPRPDDRLVAFAKNLLPLLFFADRRIAIAPSSPSGWACRLFPIFSSPSDLFLPHRHQRSRAEVASSGNGSSVPSMGATRWQMFSKFAFALPFLFAGLKVAITLAVVGAIVGEWVGSEGAGYVLLLANGNWTRRSLLPSFDPGAMGMGLFFVWVLENCSSPACFG
jgi:NitT/TauT family transport system permease protein